MTLPIRLGPAAPAIVIMPNGISMPPPTPWITRKITSSVVEEERPHSADPAVNSTSEVRNISRVPNRVAAHPVRGITAARARR